jgi:hypothetical protein
MPAITGPFPYNVDNLLGGAVRVLIADATQAVPANIADIIDMVSPYAPATGWTDLGAAKDAFSYTRAFETAGYEIQQVAGPILEEITTITRTITTSVAEITPENLGIFEEAGAPLTIAAAAGQSAQKGVSFGSFASVTQHRIAFVSRRNKASGIVTEPGGVERGRFVVGVGYLGQMSADSAEMGQAKGELTAFGLTFTLFPESTEAQGEEYGTWLLEDAGTIA